MKTRGMTIVRKRKVLNSKGEEVYKTEHLMCRFNAAIPNSHRMIVSERF